MLIDTFTKRMKRLKGEPQDVFTYDSIPINLRVQIVAIWEKCIGFAEREFGGQNPAYTYLHKSIATEFGLFQLLDESTHMGSLILFFVNVASTAQALDIIDIVFRFVSLAQHRWEWTSAFGVTTEIAAGITVLNERFREHGVGYTFVEGEYPHLIRKDNDHLHQEAVLPALRLLHEEGFKGANEEYRLAHDHYRHGRYKDCLNDCLKAFESTMKTICGKKRWPFKPTDAAKALIATCLNNGLLASFNQEHLNAIRMGLESGVPTPRNKLGGHGQGEVPVDVPRFYAEYLLHETATTIVFLVEAFKALK